MRKNNKIHYKKNKEKISMQFNQNNLEQRVPEEDTKNHVLKAREIHMLENRETHMLPPNQRMEDISKFGKAFGHEFKEKEPLEIKSSQPKFPQQTQKGKDHFLAPVRKMCECCMRFLTHKFGMSDDKAKAFMADVSRENPKFYDGTTSDSYGAEVEQGGYDSNKGYSTNQPTY